MQPGDLTKYSGIPWQSDFNECSTQMIDVTYDIPGIATSYGVQSDRVKSLPDLTRAVKDALSADKPHLIEISQRRLADS